MAGRKAAHPPFQNPCLRVKNTRRPENRLRRMKAEGAQTPRRREKPVRAGIFVVDPSPTHPSSVRSGIFPMPLACRAVARRRRELLVLLRSGFYKYAAPLALGNGGKAAVNAPPRRAEVRRRR